ncbi:RIP metalloprotease RseP [soil metagenome]
MLAFLLSLGVFVLLLSFLVFIHELGHFAVAKWCGMRVDEFAIGFPPRIWSKKRGETTYALNAIPFGGYVKIHGENPDADGEEGDEDPGSFDRKPVRSRIAVILAGIAMNTLFAFVALTVAFSAGFTSISQDLASRSDATVIRQEVLVSSVGVGSPADKAGIKPGDVVLGLTPFGEESKKVANINELVSFTKELQARNNLSLEVKYDRSGTNGVSVVTLNPTGPAMGVSIQSLDTVRVPVLQAPGVAIHEMGAILGLTWDALAGFGKKLVRAELDENVSGPIGIYQATATATKMGFSQVLFLAIVLSLNLALLNLLPIPALDGGKFVFLIVEGVFRKRGVHRKLERAMTSISFIVLIGLMIILTGRDIFRLF